jgi:hypothetical protein
MVTYFFSLFLHNWTYLIFPLMVFALSVVLLAFSIKAMLVRRKTGSGKRAGM